MSGHLENTLIVTKLIVAVRLTLKTLFKVITGKGGNSTFPPLPLIQVEASSFQHRSQDFPPGLWHRQTKKLGQIPWERGRVLFSEYVED